MLKKRIPDNYDFEIKDIKAAIEGIIGNIPIMFKGRIVEIDAELTAQQKADIKAAVLPLLENIQDITQ